MEGNGPCISQKLANNITMEKVKQFVQACIQGMSDLNVGKSILEPQKVESPDYLRFFQFSPKTWLLDAKCEMISSVERQISDQMDTCLHRIDKLAADDCDGKNAIDSHEDITSGIKLLKYEISALKIEKVDKQQTFGNSKIDKLQTCWSEVTKSPTESTELPFTLVKHGKKQRSMNSNLEVKNTVDDVALSQANIKLIKISQKKSVFCISNVQRCRRSDVMDYLSANGINVITCYPVTKKTEEKISAKTNSNNSSDEQNELKNRNEEESTVFRVCIDREDVKKIKDPEIMPQHVIVREWRFDKKTEQTVQQKINDG
ncbi:hypothetical protein HELRODRAFT_193227 [Helobdella robusta]|uniref:Uncharacterized protein n=1 Tax=Helobdella robusta TaxID=6412 RepID=T1FUR7_HELRO|nr:hypothetical protein HELRODRAFT_193227 [Helobdella robusta]ESN97516.1 hypothetical protein HELRODRAFT_193227 [Helobdella robusta]